MSESLCRILTVLLTASFLANALGTPRQNGNPQKQLYQELFESYDKAIRPVVDPSHPVEIDLQVSLAGITDLDEKRQLLHVRAWVTLMWTDAFLNWTDSEYSHIPYLVISDSKIWVPELSIRNSKYQVIEYSTKEDFYVMVMNNGYVIWTADIETKTHCPVDLTYFPLDIQECNITFIASSYFTDTLKFCPNYWQVSLNYYQMNQGWEILDTYVDNSTLHIIEMPGKAMPSVTATVLLKRKPTYFMVNLITPILLVSSISFLVYLLPVDSGEKVSLSTTVMLSYFVLLLMMADTMPRAGVTVPIILIYTLLSMTVTTLSVVATVISLYIHHHHYETPVPGWVIKLINIAGCTRESKADTNTIHPESSDTEQTMSNENDEDKKPVENFQQNNQSRLAFEKLPEWSQHERSSVDREVNWKQVACTVDRLMFGCSMALVSVTMLWSFSCVIVPYCKEHSLDHLRN